ncbi:CAP domain-containing protein [Saliphagus sp. GCM10025334]
MSRRGRRLERTRSSSERQTNRASLNLTSLVMTAVLIGAIVLAGVVLAPQAIAFVEDELGPSVEPPEPGDRNPPVTDPDDPGHSSYETETERVDSNAVEDRVHELVNERRAEHGLEPLAWDGTVASVSRAHSQDMHADDRFAHVNADDESPYDRFSDVADYCRAYGENIALTSVGTTVERSHDGEHVEYQTADELAEGLVEQWMHSDEHRATILEESDGIEGWDRGGVGVYIADDGRVFATHNFCTVRKTFDW